MIASVSSAAGESRRGRTANSARSIASAYSRRVRNCHPCAISTSSTPWSWVAYASRISARPARTASSPAPCSSVTSSPTVSGRDDANSAASSSFARGLTPDHDGSERAVLRQPQRAALGELEQRDEGGEHVHQRGALPHHVEPADLLAPGEQRLDPGDRALHVERARHNAVQHRLGDERDYPFGGGEQVIQLDHQRGRRRRGWLRAEPAPELLGAPRRRLRQPVDQLADLLVLEQPAHQLRSRVLPLVVPHAPRQQQLRLDAEQSGRHLKVVGRLIEPQLADHREELIGDFRDREIGRSEEHTSELQSLAYLVCRLLLEKKNK